MTFNVILLFIIQCYRVDVGRMVEVEPTHKPELRHRVCIPDLLGSFTDK